MSANDNEPPIEGRIAIPVTLANADGTEASEVINLILPVPSPDAWLDDCADMAMTEAITSAGGHWGTACAILARAHEMAEARQLRDRADRLCGPSRYVPSSPPEAA